MISGFLPASLIGLLLLIALALHSHAALSHAIALHMSSKKLAGSHHADEYYVEGHHHATILLRLISGVSRMQKQLLSCIGIAKALLGAFLQHSCNIIDRWRLRQYPVPHERGSQSCNLAGAQNMRRGRVLQKRIIGNHCFPQCICGVVVPQCLGRCVSSIRKCHVLPTVA